MRLAKTLMKRRKGASHMRLWVICAALTLLAACEGAAPNGAAPAAGPELAAPAPDSSPGRRFEPADDSARAAGPIVVTVSTSLGEGGASVETLTLSGAQGLAATAELIGALDPSMTLDQSTLRSRMALSVDVARALLYRVVSAEGRFCPEGAPTHLVMWEPEIPGDTRMVLLPVTGGAPGEASARACPALNYRSA